MEMTEATIAHLRDEAYALLVQQALAAQIAEFGKTRSAVAAKRPRFGVLSSRESRTAFAHTMREVDATEATLHAKHEQIMGVYQWLQPVIRKDVSSYLASVSPDYCRLLQIGARLTDWERSYRALPELLVAFARDLRAIQPALASAKKSQESVAHVLAVIRQIADRVSRQQLELSIIEQAALTAAPAELVASIRFPVLPNFQRVPWVSQLALTPRPKAHAEVVGLEAEIRAFLAGPSDRIFVEIQETHLTCANLVNHTLESYWSQLREHACAHYVEECNMDDVITMLTERYVGADIESRQRELGADQYVAQ
jgi:hypothetical protein